MLAVSTPSVRIDLPPHPIYINRALSLSCIVAVDLTVDTPITGYITWYKDNGTITNNGNEVAISSTKTNVINNTFVLSKTDNGTTFSCSATIRRSAESLFLITNSLSEEVEIIIDAECEHIIIFFLLSVNYLICNQHRSSS